MHIVYGSCNEPNQQNHIQNVYNELSKFNEKSETLFILSYEQTSFVDNDQTNLQLSRLIKVKNLSANADFFFTDTDLDEVKNIFESLTNTGKFDELFPDDSDSD
ncbi:hypothetical protein ACOME3_001598 [Neoechinorhynchus agilis]